MQLTTRAEGLDGVDAAGAHSWEPDGEQRNRGEDDGGGEKRDRVPWAHSEEKGRHEAGESKGCCQAESDSGEGDRA